MNAVEFNCIYKIQMAVIFLAGYHTKIVVSSYIIQDILSFVIYNEQNETRLSINK